MGVSTHIFESLQCSIISTSFSFIIYTQNTHEYPRLIISKGYKMKNSKNIIFVSLFIGTMLVFMLGTVIYVTSQVTNCSSAKKVKKICYQNINMKKNYSTYSNIHIT